MFQSLQQICRRFVLLSPLCLFVAALFCCRRFVPFNLGPFNIGPFNLGPLHLVLFNLVPVNLVPFNLVPFNLACQAMLGGDGDDYGLPFHPLLSDSGGHLENIIDLPALGVLNLRKFFLPEKVSE